MAVILFSLRDPNKASITGGEPEELMTGVPIVPSYTGDASLPSQVIVMHKLSILVLVCPSR